jgi:cobalt-zinc-cadmium efflux system outer membrane protein
MHRRLIPLLLLTAGCRAPGIDVPQTVEGHVQAVGGVRATLEFTPCAAAAPSPPGRLDLPALWGLALANNPTLREAAADVEAARGRNIQAGLYPNPRFLYNHDTIGSNIAPQGNYSFQVNQEIVTAGKRRLDRGVTRLETASAAVALVGRKFETLTRVRRAYYDYLGQRYLLDLSAEAVATLEQGVEITRRQVEQAKTRPRTDLIRLEALLEEARITQARAQESLEGAWRQLAAEVGVPSLPAPEGIAGLPDVPPAWDGDRVLQRVLAANTALTQARVEADRAGLAVERARAGAVPNVIVGGGYNADNTDQTAGALITAETALPVWDRQQGAIHEAKARLAFAQAAVRSAETRLARDTAEAFARYRAAGRQVGRLEAEVLPRLTESLGLLRKAYQAGSAQVTFSDLLMTEQNLNATRVNLAEARRALWLAVGDLQGLMQLDIGEDCPPPTAPPPVGPAPATDPRSHPRP